MAIEDNKVSVNLGRLDGGLVTRLPAHMIDANQSPSCQNIDPSEHGALKKRKGYIKFTSAAKVTPTGTFVSGLYAAATSGGTAYVLAAEGTVLHDITAGNWSTTVSGVTITVDTMVRMRMFNDKFIICNQGGGPFKWTGSGAAASLGGTPPANARNVEVHRARVWLAANTSVLSFSALSNEEDYTTADNAGSITINKGDGMVINGIISGGDFLIVSKTAPSSGGKEGKLYVITGSSVFDFSVKKVADVGAVGQEGMVAYDNFVAVATERGVVAIRGREPFKLSEPVDVTYVTIPNKGTIAAGRYKTTLRFAYPATGSQNNRVLNLDVERGVWSNDTGKTARIYANHPDGRLLFGTSGTSILVWEDENGTNDDGSNISMIWDTPDLDFGEWAAPKRLQATDIHAENTGATLTLEHLIDGTLQSYSQTMATATEGPVKRMPLHQNIRGKFHRLRISNNSTTAVTVYQLKCFAQLFGIGSK